jgi:hypothetical protein
MTITLETLGKSIREALNSVTESGGGSLPEKTKDFIQQKIEQDVYIKPRVESILQALKHKRITLAGEKEVQRQIALCLNAHDTPLWREYQITKEIIPDFFYDGIALEVKIKGSARSIFSQCNRYCEHEQVRALILVTSRNMGMPELINGKPCYYINLSEAWL